MYKGTEIRGGLVDVPYYQGLVEIDCDVDAELVTVASIHLREFNFTQLVRDGFTNKFIVPKKFTTSNDLFVVIFDRDRTYRAAIVDGVKAELIDGNTVNIRP
ncbi:hypothetical protein [Shewanella xiamenensis]|uniref:hypothetical protein n=1 Tax=Shewanella xiamenensis TaxID=332186 RepID=UPI00217D5524|nr:hypothetical protein [Shewanella xiamenensis]MCT8871363.1 hypothetical protein [Shewanella xiamenensis]UWH42876.1 hypothetical protein KXJ80_06350 [Shewanella xiamenensis]